MDDGFKKIEDFLFSCCWEEDPGISPFSIIYNGETYNYQIAKVFGCYYVLAVVH